MRKLAAAFSVAGVRVLCKSQRRRYREEFRIELVKLPRREQLGYAMRVLIGLPMPSIKGGVSQRG